MEKVAQLQANFDGHPLQSRRARSVLDGLKERLRRIEDRLGKAAAGGAGRSAWRLVAAAVS